MPIRTRPAQWAPKILCDVLAEVEATGADAWLFEEERTTAADLFIGNGNRKDVTRILRSLVTDQRMREPWTVLMKRATKSKFRSVITDGGSCFNHYAVQVALNCIHLLIEREINGFVHNHKTWKATTRKVAKAAANLSALLDSAIVREWNDLNCWFTDPELEHTLSYAIGHDESRDNSMRDLRATMVRAMELFAPPLSTILNRISENATRLASAPKPFRDTTSRNVPQLILVLSAYFRVTFGKPFDGVVATIVDVAADEGINVDQVKMLRSRNRRHLMRR